MIKKRETMRAFPGPLKKIKGTKVYILNGWQLNWLKDYYPTNTNKALAEAMGITQHTFERLVQGRGLEKDKEWMYYERCKRIHKHPQGCGVERDVTIQKNGTITIATKLCHSDYNLLCWLAKKHKMNKYEYLQGIVRRVLKAESPVKDGELFAMPSTS